MCDKQTGCEDWNLIRRSLTVTCAAACVHCIDCLVAA